jgi:hypothetical protein
MERFSVSSNPQLLDVSQIPKTEAGAEEKWWMDDRHIPGSIPESSKREISPLHRPQIGCAAQTNLLADIVAET